MENIVSGQAVLLALLIFGLRIVDMALDTLRILFMVRERRKLVWVCGFFQALVFVIALTTVLSNLDSILNILAYAAGFATGNVIGMYIEERLALGHIQLTIISSSRGAAIAEQLRASGFAVTELPARGRDGVVSLLTVNVIRRNVSTAETIALENDPEAFITAEEVRPMRRGFWRA